jgi:hypothetical protein
MAPPDVSFHQKILNRFWKTGKTGKTERPQGITIWPIHVCESKK